MCSADALGRGETSCHHVIMFLAKSEGGDATENDKFQRGNVGLQGYKNFTCHHVIMSSCHHVIMSSCHDVIMSCATHGRTERGRTEVRKDGREGGREGGRKGQKDIKMFYRKCFCV